MYNSQEKVNIKPSGELNANKLINTDLKPTSL